MEDKAENWLIERRGVVLAAGTLRYERKRCIRADGPVPAILKFVERLTRHEQDDLAVPGHPEGEADRGRGDVVVIDRLAADSQRAFAEFPSDPSTTLVTRPNMSMPAALLASC